MFSARSSSFLFLILSTGCVIQENGSTFSGPSPYRDVLLSGYTLSPNDPVTIQVLDPADQNPSPGANWTTLATAYTNTTPEDYTDADGNTQELYYWEATVHPVTTFGTRPRWREGGLARFRALRGAVALTTFDEFDCVAAAYVDGATPIEMGEACGSHSTPVLTFVDTDPISANVQPYLSRDQNGGVPATEAAEYNTTIGADLTLNAWKSARGFPTGEVVARYYNRGDLGIGREMHCRENPGGTYTLSCYVSNYGHVDDGFDDAESALADAISGTNKFATVAMDYKPAGHGVADSQVQFYTYNGVGGLLVQAALDSEGNKYVPALCINCHGGTYNPATNLVTGARFLPFDLNAFDFAASGSYSKSNQQEEFRKLNVMVYNANPGAGGTSITSLINGWYNNQRNTVGRTQISDWVPPGFADHSVLYRKAVAPYCRTCHIAGAFRFDTFDQLNTLSNAAKTAVCDTHEMPHAEATRKSFWESSARAHLAGELNWATDCK